MFESTKLFNLFLINQCLYYIASRFQVFTITKNVAFSHVILKQLYEMRTIYSHFTDEDIERGTDKESNLPNLTHAVSGKVEF